MANIDLKAFASEHVTQITVTVVVISYALLRNKLTLGGIIAGIISVTIHIAHPWPAFFWLLIVFFLVGTLVTRIGHAAKTHLTQSSTGGTGGEGARTSAQVLANSAFASVLILLHAYLLSQTPFTSSFPLHSLPPGIHLPTLARLLPIGIIAQYAAVAADTCSSELGILSRSTPFMITAPWRRVPRGTNGGVTVAGLAYGLAGSAVLVGVAATTLRFSSGVAFGVSGEERWMDVRTAALLAGSGLAGSVLDSVIGALAQVTVTDKGTGKVVEGHGGARVLVAKDGGRAKVGRDLLTNNGVNFVMASLTGLGAMAVAYVLNLSI